MSDFFGQGSADPLAQSFTIPQEFTNGVFVTSVGLYFAEKGNETLPVFVQICEMTNGYPTGNVLKNASGILTASDIVTSTDGKKESRCKFNALVYLEPNKEYALKVLSNSIKYKLWIAQMGEKRVDKALYITEQPSTGSLFKSQNNSTWSPDQLQDLKFTLYYAKFDISKSGQVNLSNSPASLRTTLPPNPFLITNGSPIVKVYHPNHGMTAGKLITYSGSNYAAMNAQFTITAVIDSDRYVVTLGSNSTVTDTVGGAAVKCYKSIKFDSFNIQSAAFLTDKTGINYTAKFTGLNGKDANYISHKPGIFEELDEPKFIYSNENEQVFLSNTKSLDVVLDIYSSDSAVSPIISAESLAIALQSNKLDSRTDTTYAPIVGESAPTGNTAESRYISVPAKLNSTASELKFMFSANVPYPSTIELWYRTTMDSAANPLNNVSWTQVPLTLENSSGLQFTEITSDVVTPEAFTQYQSKIVFKSPNSAKAPKIKDFRCIALS
jgi:hypothetical protein